MKQAWWREAVNVEEELSEILLDTPCQVTINGRYGYISDEMLEQLWAIREGLTTDEVRRL